MNKKKTAKKPIAPAAPYWKQRQALKLKAPHSKTEVLQVKRKAKEARGAFFNAATLQAPSRCENCGNMLAPTIKFHPRAHIAHILPKTEKGGTPSVATHPKNKWFACLSCHTFYDKSLADRDYYEIGQMHVFPILVQRFNDFEKEIAPTERRRIPEIFINENKQATGGRRPPKNKGTE